MLQRQKPRGKILKVVKNSSEETFHNYVLFEEGQIEIEMKDIENPIVTLLPINGSTEKVIDVEEDDSVLRRDVEQLSGKQVLEEVGIGALNVFTFLTNLA